MGRKLGRIPKAGRKIIGVSMTPELASKVKIEAGRRQISIKQLFVELWALYENQSPRKTGP